MALPKVPLLEYVEGVHVIVGTLASFALERMATAWEQEGSGLVTGSVETEIMGDNGTLEVTPRDPKVVG